MNNEMMIKLQHFFAVDINMKKEIYTMAPVSLNDYINEREISKYVDKLNDTLIYIFSELKVVAVDIFRETKVLEKICKLEQEVKNNFYSSGYDINKIKNFYHRFISNMSEDFINSTKRECVGYTFGTTDTIEKASTINEVLHFLHSYIVNNEDILQSIPLISEKENKYGYKISLRGANTPVFEQLFKLFPYNLDCGWTDMVAVNEKKLILMVRDRGHALTIEITINKDIARMEYFIPKLCNIEMINNLPGINKVNENSPGGTGVLEVSLEELPLVLYDFISKVPTDDDMIIPYHR